jgi:transcriptional regulator with XRE-family HTH domain
MPPTSTIRFAGRLSELIDAVRDEKGNRYSAREIAKRINRRHGPGSISHTYVTNLISGRGRNPSLRTVEMISDVFDVTIGYFFDQPDGSEVDHDLRAVVASREDGVGRVAVRMIGISERGLDALARTVEHIRSLEGLPDMCGSSSS